MADQPASQPASATANLSGRADTASAAPPAALPRRRDEIDAIRILTCFSVILGHVIAVFGTDVVFHVKNADLSPLLGHVYELRHAWSMPAFFMMAGWAAIVGLRAKGVRVFFENRVRRLLIPWVVGMVLLAPAIKYHELLAGFDLRPSGPRISTDFSMDYLEFLGVYFTHINRFTWSHLWFLAYLMIMSAALLPLLYRMARRTRWPDPGRLAATTLAWAPMALFGLWLVATDGWWPYYPNLQGDYANFVYFTLFFLAGCLVAAWPALDAAVSREWWRLGLAGCAALVAMLWFVDTMPGRLLTAAGAWGVVCALYGGLRRVRFRRGPVFRYLTDAVMPLFILHNALVVVVGYHIVGLDAGLWTKVALLLVVAVGGSLILYQLLIRSWPPMRLLFGAPPRRPGRARPTNAAEGDAA